MTKTIKTREQFVALFSAPQDAIAFENDALQAGREFLPAQAILVRAGSEPSPEYWQWLADQLSETQHDTTSEEA